MKNTSQTLGRRFSADRMVKPSHGTAAVLSTNAELRRLATRPIKAMKRSHSDDYTALIIAALIALAGETDATQSS